MGRPSKFTAARRAAILEMLSVGASRRTAAAVAGIDHATLGRWISRGGQARAGSSWAKFAVDVGQAEAAPRIRALKIVHEAMPDRPELAFKFLERREHGFAPKTSSPPVSSMLDTRAPTVIQLQFPGRPLPPVRRGDVTHVQHPEHALPEGDE